MLRSGNIVLAVVLSVCTLYISAISPVNYLESQLVPSFFLFYFFLLGFKILPNLE